MEIFEKKYSSYYEITQFGAFESDKTVEFLIEIPRAYGAVSVWMNIKADGLEKNYNQKHHFLWMRLDGSNDVYGCKIDMSELGVGLYYYNYEINSFFGKEFYGERGCGGRLHKLNCNDNGLIQLTVYKPPSELPEWIFGGIIYHIFVDRFNKSGRCVKKDYAVINEDWESGIPQFADYPGGYVQNNMFFGGDLYGIIEKLDYIKSLGVNCIYLSPIFEAYSNHKYDTADYMHVDSMFGGDAAFEELVSETKKRDIHIILDGVFNHTGSDSIYFNKNSEYKSVGAYQSEKSKYYSWYNFRSFPDDYECWWNVKILPRVNCDCKSYRNFILGSGGVVEKWIHKGASGFRLDVADELSDDFLTEFNKKVKSLDSKGIIYGEVWEDASNKIAYDKRKQYFRGNELDSVMNYPLKDAIINYVKYGNISIADVCETLYLHYPKNASDLLMNVLGTHDTERVLTVLGGESSNGYTNKELSEKRMTSSEMKKAISLLKISYAIIATLPGIPCIYYGDEAGMQGYGDPFNRMPYPWGRENCELINFYKKIGKIRRFEKLYARGLFKIIECTPDIFAFARYDEANFVLTVANRSARNYKINSDCILKNIETQRIISSVCAHEIYILKSNFDINKANIHFYEQ